MVNLTANATAEEIKAIAAMTNEQRANLAAQINSTDPATIFDLVENKTDEIICPFCGSGTHGKKNTGIKPTKKNGVWLYRCFAGNDCDGDLIKIIADANHLSTRGKDFFEVLAIAAKICNIFIPSSGAQPPQKKEVIKTDDTKKVKEVKKAEPFERLAEAQKNLEKFVKSQGGKWRGLSLETLQHMHAGFLHNIYFPEPKKELPAVVIPNDLNGVYFRAIEGKFHKNNSPTATTTIYLPNSDTFDVIITEGQINAASIFQAVFNTTNDVPNFAIIASGGTSGNKHVVSKFQELKTQGKNFRALIAYDGDSNQAGQNAADKLFKALLKAGFNACTVDITEQADVDCNDILRKDGGDFLLFDMVQKILAQIVDAPADETPNADLAMFEVPKDYVPDPAANDDDTFEKRMEKLLKDKFEDEETQKFFIPLPYVVTNHGIKKNGKKEISTICPRPVLIKDQFFNLDDKTYKLTLEYMDAIKIWKSIHPQSRGVIFNKNKIVDLVKFGLPITTSNATANVDWLYNLFLDNEKIIPTTYTVNRCGWYTYKDNQFFIDPRIKNTVQEDGKNIDIVVDSDDQMAQSLKTSGTLEEWKKAYLLAADSTVARLQVAASVAPVLLKVLGERNFVLYIHGKTRGGKSTSLNLAASAVGTSDLVRVFDGTTTALNSLAVDTNHYPFFVDEKQSADAKLKADFQRWIYNDANGIERARAKKDGTVKPLRSWQHITICNGETLLLDDLATGGAYTRILQVAAPNIILDADKCKKIREITGKNYGHAFPLVVRQVQQKENCDELRKNYQEFQSAFESYCKCNDISVIPDYIRYVALLFIADQTLITALNIDIPPLEYGQIFKMLPTSEETDGAKRFEPMASAFIGSKIGHFDNIPGADKRPPSVDCYGRYKDGYLYIIASIFNKYLEDNGLDYKFVVANLISSGYFVPDDKVEAGNKPRDTIVKKINGQNQRCYKVKFDAKDDKKEYES